MSINTASIRNTIASMATNEHDWNELLNELLQMFNCTTGTIHTLNEKDNTLIMKAYRGIPEKLLPIVSVIPVGKGMAGIAAQRKEPVQVCNLQSDNSGVARPGAKETKVEGSLTAPLLHEGKLYGTLGIAKPVPYDFTDEEVAALMEIGDAICLRIALG